jgi:hypothetical protein
MKKLFAKVKLICMAYESKVGAAKRVRDRDLAALFVCEEYQETGINKRSEWLDVPGSERIRSSQAGGFRYGPNDR